MPTNEPMRFCSADSVHKFLLIQIHGDMNGGGGAECTRERREEGAAADIRFYKKAGPVQPVFPLSRDEGPNVKPR